MQKQAIQSIWLLSSFLLIAFVHYSCKEVEQPKPFNITSSACIKNFNTASCPDSNLFHIMVKGSVRGSVGTILVIGTSFADSVVMNCGSWTNIQSSNPQYTFCERKDGQSEEAIFEYRGYKTEPCLTSNSYFNDVAYSLFTTVADQYGNPSVFIWDPDGEFRHGVVCSL